MDLRFTPEETAFRDEVRAFFRTALPERIRDKVADGPSRSSKDDIVAWQRILNAKGWAVPHWPEEWGGTGWSPVQLYIFQEEMQQAPAPEPLPFGVSMVGPVIIAFGTRGAEAALPAAHRQSRRLVVPGLLRARRRLRPRLAQDQRRSATATTTSSTARRPGPRSAQYADWIFVPGAHRSRRRRSRRASPSCSIDMKTPGITVRPILTIDGSHEVNEVFFDDVQVPVENRVGEENKGWDYAKFLLGNERTGIARVGASKAQVRRMQGDRLRSSASATSR